MAAKRWPSCSVFQTGPEWHQVWHFDPKGRKFAARGTQQFPVAQPLPARVGGKSWHKLIQPRLNIAWLPPESVFLRVVQMPLCAPEELGAMVELQLEKLSPLPPAQTVWTTCVVGEGAAGMQTVLVVLAERDAVEAFVGKIEQAGLLADRLDIPGVDRLLALKPAGDGAYVFPELCGGPDTALAGWWYGGVLRHLGLLQLPQEGNRAASVDDQLRQMAWAGEIEGWLTAPPHWHLVAEGEQAERWLPWLREGLRETVSAVAPPPTDQLALSSATRGVTALDSRGLLPEEFASRYKQQFNDRLWMRGLGALMVIYLLGIAVYFSLVGAESWRAGKLEAEIAGLGNTYTNALQLKERFGVLNDLQELKYAALDSWKLTSELMPERVTLDALNFEDGSKLTLSGSAPEDAVPELIEFSAAMRRARVNDRPVFDANQGEPLTTRLSPRGGSVSWNFSLVLRRSEVR